MTSSPHLGRPLHEPLLREARYPAVRAADVLVDEARVRLSKVLGGGDARGSGA